MRLDEITSKVTHKYMEYALCETLRQSVMEAASCGYATFDPIHPLLPLAQVSLSVTLRKRLDPMLSRIGGDSTSDRSLRAKVEAYAQLDVEHDSHDASKRMFEIMLELSNRRSSTTSALMTRGDLAVAIFLCGSPLVTRLLDEIGLTPSEMLISLGAPDAILRDYLAPAPSS